LSNRKSGSVKETEDQIRSTPQTSKTEIKHGTNILFCFWAGIPEMLFDIAMTIFFRIELWSISR